MMKTLHRKSPGFLLGGRSNTKENTQIRLAQKGDRNAFTQIYDQYIASVYGFIFSRVSNAMVAEDLTSQVFLKAWESIERFHEQGVPFRAWLFRIARNTIIDHYRTAKSHECIDLLPSDESDPDEDIEEKLNLHLEGEELAEAMEQLTEDQRQAICLRFLEGLNTQEVAHAMGKGAGAIRALQMRGLQTLAKILKLPEGEVNRE